jgi:hypothetical protein
MKKSLYCIESTSADLRYWAGQPGLTAETRHSIEKADILVVPQEGFRNHTGPIFPVGTEAFLQSLRQQAPADIHIDIAIEDTDYRELAIHADLLTVADVVVKYVVAPIAVTLLTEYLKRRLGSRFRNDEVRVGLTVDQTDGETRRAVRISYEGPAQTFETAFKEALTVLGGKTDSSSPGESSGPRSQSVPKK